MAKKPEKDKVHMQLTTGNLELLIAGKDIEEICNLRDKMDELAKIALIKDTIQAFDDNRAEGAVVTDAECVAVGSSLYDGDDERLTYGTRIEYKITIITPATDDEIKQCKGWEKEREDEREKQGGSVQG
jgi:hypothetical protein